jgi:hypothetical protein
VPHSADPGDREDLDPAIEKSSVFAVVPSPVGFYCLAASAPPKGTNEFTMTAPPRTGALRYGPGAGGVRPPLSAV